MKKFFRNAKNRMLLATSAVGATLGGTATALAEPDASTIVGRVLGIVCSVFRYIGIVLLAWSIGMLILAFKNEDADSKSRAIMLIVVSIALIALKTLLGEILGSDLGVSIDDSDF